MRALIWVLDWRKLRWTKKNCKESRMGLSNDFLAQSLTRLKILSANRASCSEMVGLAADHAKILIDALLALFRSEGSTACLDHG